MYRYTTQEPTPGDIAAAQSTNLDQSSGIVVEQSSNKASSAATGFVPTSTCTPNAVVADDQFDNNELVPYGLRMVGALDETTSTNGFVAKTVAASMTNSLVMVCVIDTGMYANTIAPDLPPGFVGGVAPTGTNPDYTNKCRYNWDQGSLHGGHVFGTVAAWENSASVRGVSGCQRLAPCGIGSSARTGHSATGLLLARQYLADCCTVAQTAVSWRQHLVPDRSLVQAPTHARHP
jgi:hypothetical protein